MVERGRRSFGLIVPWPDAHKSTRFGLPIGPLYICSSLEAAGWRVKLLHLSHRPGDIEVKIGDFVRDQWVIGVSIAGYARQASGEILQTLRAVSPELTIVVGGADITLKRGLPDCADYGICGEAETALVDLLEQLRDGRSPSVDGLITRSHLEHGNSVTSSLASVDVDLLPFPARSLIRSGQEWKYRNATSILTARGCSGRCAFCARPRIQGAGYRPRSTLNVVDELEALQSDGYRTVAVIDDNFLYDQERAESIARSILDRGIRLEMSVSGWAKVPDAKFYELLRKSGVRAISFGLESGNEQILRLYRKPLTRETMANAIRACDAAGIFTVGNFIFGAPEETRDDMRHTLDYILTLPLDTVKMKVLGYTHGSELWSWACRENLLAEDEFNVLAGRERGLSPMLTSEILDFCREATRLFHERKEHKDRLRSKIQRWGAPYTIS